jgi:hypothetical protein
MSRINQVLLSAVIIAIAAQPVAAFAQAADPATGTWVLNLARSAYDPGPPPKSQTRTYTPTANGYKFSGDAVSILGDKSHTEFIAVFDNKFHRIAGSPIADSIMVRRINATTVETIQKQGARVVTSSMRTISKDGKTLTNTSKGTTPDGQTYTKVEVFERK